MLSCQQVSSKHAVSRDSSRPIKRLTSAFADERDGILAAACQTELKAAAREHEVLQTEQRALQSSLSQETISQDDIQSVL